MLQRKPRKFRHRSNERRYLPRSNGDLQAMRGSNTFANGQTRNNYGQTRPCIFHILTVLCFNNHSRRAFDSSLVASVFNPQLKNRRPS